ncbi:hypothetical protein EKO04_001707 [Ascochyta lentis]|uniref:Uncharacterized protein n=1 Tax=Ascochyta lentis TaxID=205686 RepID=A0A8H7J8N9_9PLEO|nr:hypothetical protein EKO04_001707 [Ascochyta lentis]
MDTATTANAADEHMPDASATCQQPSGQSSRSVAQLKTSKYTTVLLTTSGYISQDNNSWRVLRPARASDLGGSAVNAEAEELFECQGEERRSEVGRETISYKSKRDMERPADQGADELSISDRYFDHNSYFRYLGWTGCASLQHPVVVDTTSRVSPAEMSPARSVIPGFADESANEDDIHAKNVPVDKPGSTSVAASGFATKRVKVPYHPDENAWLLLLCKKVKAAAELGRKIKNPGPAVITPLFNAFFEGRILQDEHGGDLPPREAREELSIKGKIMKINTEIRELRYVTRKLLEGSRGGELYAPNITVEELRQFQADGTVRSELP